MEAVDHAIDLKPDSLEVLYDRRSARPAKFPWRLDDEKLMYPFYEKAVRAGINTICIHKGLLPKDYETPSRRLALRHGRRCWQGGEGLAADEFRHLPLGIACLHREADERGPNSRTGRVRWTSDLAAIPEKFGVTNVYAELGTSFAISAVAHPQFCAAFMGTLIKGLGYDHVLWGTDRSSMAPRNGRSRRSAAWRSPKTCRRNTALRRWAPPMARSSRGFSA